MDIEDDLSCPCGKRFTRSSAALHHRRSCVRTISRVTSLLENAKKAWKTRRNKRAKIAGELPNENFSKAPATSATAAGELPPDYSQQLRDTVAGTSTRGTLATDPAPISHSTCYSAENLTSNLSESIAQRRTPRKKKASSRLADFVAHSVVSSPSQQANEPSSELSANDKEPTIGPSQVSSSREDAEYSSPRESGLFSTMLNRFRLFRTFFSVTNATADPDPGEHGFADDTQFYKNIQAIPLTPFNPSSSPNSIETTSSTDTSNDNISSCPRAEDDRTSSVSDVTGVDYAPYPNLSSFLLGEWFWNGGTQKSQRDFDNLMKILKSHEFNIEDVQTTQWRAINHNLGLPSTGTKTLESKIHGLSGNGDRSVWIHRQVKIEVPFHAQQLAKNYEPGPKPFIVGEFRYQTLLSILREKVSGPDFSSFHLDPYELRWLPKANQPSQRVYGELYTSPAFLEAHKELQSSPPEDGCDLPRVIAGLMFASDETHLTQFGDTKLWPLYLTFGNDSKYRRCKPTEHLCYHVAYFTKLPDTFKEFVSSHIGKKKVPSTLITHCIREVLHAQWEIIIDEEFLEAYRHGVVILCYDGVKRRFYPRIFIYSADYKEKVVIAGTRSVPAQCPCPRCFTPLREFHNLGTPEDRAWRQQIRKDNDEYKKNLSTARKNLYQELYSLDGKYVDGVLKDTSFSPTQNAFSRLTSLGVDMFGMVVVDQMHEIEAGNWKALFIHLLRILHCCDDKSLIHTVDSRFRRVPTFGGDTIRKFSKNMTEMKSLAARDWEDMLQCAIPVFEGLLPEPHNGHVIDLLFVLAHWHGLAKLKLHTDKSLDILDNLTTDLGEEFRRFKLVTCAEFKTQELPKEADARSRRQNSREKSKKPKGKAKSMATTTISNASAESQTQAEIEETSERTTGNNPIRKYKEFNLQTYKFHAFGDYVGTIRQFGTTDSYSTESSELEHRSSKDRYKRTSKKNFTTQMSQIERRQTQIRHIRHQVNIASDATKSPPKTLNLDEATPSLSGSSYTIGKSENHPVYLFDFINGYQGDPAIKGFLGDLKSHLLPRARLLFGLGKDDPDIAIFFQHDRIYKHQTLRISYDTYDLRDDEDVINPDTPHRDIMMLRTSDELTADNELHPFLYARVLGIYHANVICAGHDIDAIPRRLDFLWVRWYEYEGPAQRHRLDRLRFPSLNDDNAFGFVDPGDVLRGCHIIPSFSSGKKSDNVVKGFSATFWYPKQRLRLETQPIPGSDSKARSSSGLSGLAQDRDDWNLYYINPFVDRDMLMRYHWGLAVGHMYCHHLPQLTYFFDQVSDGTEHNGQTNSGVSEPSNLGNAPACSPSNKEPSLSFCATKLTADASGNSPEDQGEMDPVIANGCFHIQDPEAEVLGSMETQSESEGSSNGHYYDDDVDMDSEEAEESGLESDGD